VAVVGYTNAGKSTLLNTLTNADVYTADQLFATLDPTTRRLSLTEHLEGDERPRSLVLVDTVGFIQDLPPSLVDSFRATLEEVTEADALMHVVDLSHPAWQEQIQSVEGILADMPMVPGPTLLVFNKIDQVESEDLEVAKIEYPHAVFIAARDRLGLVTLRQRLSQLVEYSTES
jgi:GTP-binding protein HflX